MKNHKLIEIEWPDFGCGEKPAGASANEYRERLSNAREAMVARGLSHLVVYGDREHFANILYLTGFDPRFEEAVLVVGVDEAPLLLVGNECEGYLTVAPLYNEGELRHELFQSLSLISQPRASSREIKEIFASEGVGEGSRVGCAGWKYFTDAEAEHPESMIEIPAYMVDALRELAGGCEQVLNVTDMFMHPTSGLRCTCTATEIAYFEYMGILASEGVKSMLMGAEEGMVDYDLAKLIGYNGEALCCHLTLCTGANRDKGLSGPVGGILKRGDPLSSNLGYWGSNVCRAGWIAESEDDLPDNAKDYVKAFAGRYFEVMNEWFKMLKIGTSGGDLYRIVAEGLPHEEFGIGLNPGHLIHMDEWVSSPIYEGSSEVIRSGMAMQVDVIPSSPVYFSTRMEDGLVIADAELRGDIKAKYPDCYERCVARRKFVREVLGVELGDEVLPLSNIMTIVPPFLLRPELVFALD